MTEFENACNTENYTGSMTQENVIEWIKGDKTATVTFAGSTKFCNKIKKLAESYPDEVKIVALNPDASVVAHIPISYIKITRPREVVMSEERKQFLNEVLRKARDLKSDCGVDTVVTTEEED